MNITAVHTYWPEAAGFTIEINGWEDHYVFIHFHTEVALSDGAVIKPGGCILYRPHSYRFFKAEKCALYHDWMNIDGDLDSLLKKYGIKCNHIYYPRDYYKITEIISAIEREKQLNSKFCSDICRLKTEELFIQLTREFDARDAHARMNVNTYKKLLHVRQTFRTRYREIDAVEKYASQIGLSPSRFYVLYSSCFGISPKQDLINIRMEHAKQLFQYGFGVFEAAELVGYTNIYHFSRQFKKYTGMAPTQYKKTLDLAKENIKHRK